jgi:hypothetical protein
MTSAMGTDTAMPSDALPCMNRKTTEWIVPAIPLRMKGQRPTGTRGAKVELREVDLYGTGLLDVLDGEVLSLGCLQRYVSPLEVDHEVVDPARVDRSTVFDLLPDEGSHSATASQSSQYGHGPASQRVTSRE